jgi:hypothetical protein
MEHIPCFSCKTDILWAVPFLQKNRGDINESDETIIVEDESAVSWNEEVVADFNVL